MPHIIPDEIQIKVDTLLEVGDRVFEVSEEHIITGVWCRDCTGNNCDQYPGKKVTDTPHEGIIALCDARISEGFRTGKNSYNEYTITVNGVPVTYSARIIASKTGRKSLFVVLENLSNKEEFQLVEDKWRLALDAAGDGVWDFDMQTGAVIFSEKWLEVFGYSADEIKSADEWMAKIHPDDFERSKQVLDDYLEGRNPSYWIEVRFRYKDGVYRWIQSRGVVISKDADGKAVRAIGTHTDINERKIAEEKYHATAELSANLIDNLQMGILVTDDDYKVVFVNQLFCDLYDIKSGPASLLGSDVRQGLEVRKLFFKDEQGFYDRTKQIIAQKELVLNEEWECKDGRVLKRDFVPIKLDQNSAGGIWKLRDITDQKKIARQVEDQRRFYEKILNHIPADIAVFGPDHTYLFVNKNGFKDDELRAWMIGKTDVDYARRSNRPDSFVTNRFEMYDRAAREGKSERIEKLVNKQGVTEYHLRLLAPSYMESGEVEFILAYGLDVTELLLAQDALKTSMETFSSAFVHSGIGMALISPGGHWLDMNDVILKITGYTKEELKRLTYHDVTYPGDLDKDRDLVRQMLKKEITTYTLEKRYISKEKRIVWVSLTLSMVWNSDETPKFFIAQVLDISQKKELEQEINKRNSELEATKNSLVNKVKQLEELSYIVAHNLRGPAGNIKVIAAALVAKNKGGDFAKENPLSNAFTNEEGIAYIEESSASLMSSLSTLMKITEIKLNNKIPYNLCDVAVIVNHIIAQLHSTIHEKGAVIKLDLQFPEVSYPKAYMENILYNLISNALKYSKDGIPPEICIATRMVQDRMQLVIKDNGLGINMEKYGHLVFKLNNVFHKGFDSKGVGLYITKNQVESLGGTIEVTSVENDGCEFTVTL